MQIVRKNNGKNHWYIDQETNQRLPGVTTITSGGTPKDSLINWAGKATAGYALDNWDALAALPPAARLDKMLKGRYEDRDRAANRGTEVHALGERLIKGERLVVPDELAGYVQSYARFLDDFEVREVFIDGYPLTEVVVYSERGQYVGTLDLICDLLLPDVREYEDVPRDDDGYVRSLVDLKTTRSGIFGETALQIAGYRYCNRMILGDARTVDNPGRVEIDMPAVDFTGAVHVRPNGYDLIPVKADEDTFLSFRYVMQVYRYDQGSRDLVGAPVTPPTASTYHLTKVDQT